MELDRDDFKALAQLGSALWPDASRAEAMTQDALAAVALMDLSPQRSLEKMAEAMIEQFRQVRLAPESLNHPFYRLLPQERFVLAALHLSHWSYARLARILRLSREELETLAWQARLHLARQLAAAQGRPLVLPAGPRDGASVRMTCPPFDARRPWTQVLLDDEWDSRERLSVQNHLMTCRSCQSALSASRTIYHSVEDLLVRLASGTEETADRYERFWTRVRRLRRPGASFLATLPGFFMRRDILLALALMLALFALKLS